MLVFEPGRKSKAVLSSEAAVFAFWYDRLGRNEQYPRDGRANIVVCLNLKEDAYAIDCVDCCTDRTTPDPIEWKIKRAQKIGVVIHFDLTGLMLAFVGCRKHICPYSCDKTRSTKIGLLETK